MTQSVDFQPLSLCPYMVVCADGERLENNNPFPFLGIKHLIAKANIIKQVKSDNTVANKQRAAN